MTDDSRLADLAALLALKQMRAIPFPAVIRAMAGVDVIPLDRSDEGDQTLLAGLAEAARRVGAAVRDAPIRRNRPNEVGNDIEPFVMDAIAAVGLRSQRPRTAAGRGLGVGYPDILIHDEAGRPTYVECKVFGEDKALTTMRSFYLSPSEHCKIVHDARHVLMAFAINREPIAGSPDSLYRVTSFKLLDLHGLTCDVKYEFNSDNRRLYDEAMVVAAGTL